MIKSHIYDLVIIMTKKKNLNYAIKKSWLWHYSLNYERKINIDKLIWNYDKSVMTINRNGQKF